MLTNNQMLHYRNIHDIATDKKTLVQKIIYINYCKNTKETHVDHQTYILSSGHQTLILEPTRFSSSILFFFDRGVCQHNRKGPDKLKQK
jgi:hypothetical protein